MLGAFVLGNGQSVVGARPVSNGDPRRPASDSPIQAAQTRSSFDDPEASETATVIRQRGLGVAFGRIPSIAGPVPPAC
jgi:hypothetical protein